MSGVTALACDAHDGTVLVGLSDSTTAFRFHPSDGTFDPIALPADGVVTMMATATDGDVAIGLQSTRGAGPNRVMVVPHDGSANRIVEVRDSLVVKADGTRFLVGTAAQVIEPGATAASAPLIPDSVVWRFQPGSTVPWPLADGRLVVRGAAPTPAIIEVHPSMDGRPPSTVPVAIGTQRCGPPPVITEPYGPSGPPVTDPNPNVATTTLDPNRPCPILPWEVFQSKSFVVDKVGDVYCITLLRDPNDLRATSFPSSLIRVQLP
jgi:hypothetical protein